MSKLIVKINDFSVSNLSIGPMKSLESGGKMASLFYKYGDNSSSSLTTQVGSLSLPYGMNVFDKAGPVKYSMDLSLRGYDENAKVKAIYDAFTALDNWMIDQGVKNSKAWFKSDLTRDVVKAFYTPTVRWAKDAEGNIKPYPPTVKLQLRKRDEKFDVEMYDENKRELKGVPLEDVLVKGAQVTCLIQATSVWFAGSKFGISWKALQIRMDKIPDNIRGYAIQDEDEDGTSHAVAAPVRRVAPAPAPVAAANKFGPLEDDDDEEEEEVAPAPAPARPSVLAAMMPQAPAPAPVADEDAEDVEPVQVPKKTTVTKKAIVKKTVGKQ